MNDQPHDCDPLAEILLAQEFPEPGGELGRADFALLHRGATSGVLAPEVFAHMFGCLCAGGSLAHATRDRFDLVMDYLFGYGFRDPALPEVAPDYLGFLDAARRRMGIADDAFAAMLARAPGGVKPGHVTGGAFGWCLYELFHRQGWAIPNLPPRSFMSRTAMGDIVAAARGLGLTYPEHMGVVTAEGGGCLRPRDLDKRGATRVLARYFAAGYIHPAPPPRVEPRPGFITQAQANLIWKLARDLSIPDAAGLDEWLAGITGIEGGLTGMTAAGASYVIGRMLAPVIAIRDEQDRQARERAARQYGEAAGV